MHYRIRLVSFENFVQLGLVREIALYEFATQHRVAIPGGQIVESHHFLALLQQVRRTVLDALANQDYPFPVLVERLQPARDPSRPPLVQVLFVLAGVALMVNASIDDPVNAGVTFGLAGVGMVVYPVWRRMQGGRGGPGGQAGPEAGG